MKIDLIQASPLPFHRIRQWLSLCLLMTMASTPTAFSATETWTIGIGTANWSTAANWTGTNLPPISGDSLIFGNTAGVTTLNNDLTLTGLGTITFNADAPAYTIGGNAVIATVDGQGGLGGIVLNSASNVTQTININFTSRTNAVPVTGAGNLDFNGTLTKGGTYNPYLQMNGTGVLTLGGAGSFNTAGATNPLEANSGTVVLAKTTAGGFNVGLRINGGTVKLGYAEQLRSHQGLIINGGTLDLNGFDSALGGNGAVVADGASSGVNHNGGLSHLTGLGGRVTNNAAGNGTNWLVINQGGGQQASYGGTISDGATAKVGVTVVANYNQTAFQALAGNNTYSGGTFIQHNYTGSGGRPEVLSIGNVASIGAAGFRDLTFKGAASSADVILQLTGTAVTNSNQFDGMTFTSGLGAGIDVADPNNTFTLGKNAGGTDIAFTGGGVFEKLGAGTLVITGSLGYTGGTYLGGGTLKIDAQAGGGLATTSAPVFAGGNLYLLGKTSGTTTQTLGNVSLAQLNNYGANSGGASVITVEANGGAGTTLALGTLPNSTSAGYTLNIKTLTGGQVSTTTTTTTNGLVGNGRILYTDASGATDFASIPGSGTRYIQAATYTAGLPTSGSNLNTNYSQADNASVTASESVNALKLTTSTTGQSLAITSGETLSLKTGGLLFTGANDYSITGGTLKSTNSATTPDLIVHQYGTGALTIGSVIANGGTGASTLTKAGNGTLVLSGANTYGGQTYVTGGILSISSDSNLNGANGTFTGITSATNSASVTSNASSLPAGFGVGSTILGRTVNAIGGTSGAYTITLSGNANTAFTANSGVASWAHASALGLYSGGVLRADGTFSLQEVGTGGSGGAATTTANRSITIGNSGGGFDVTTGNTLTITGNINATGMMTKSGAGTLTLSAGNNLTGGLTIHDGTVKQGADKSITNNNSGTATSNLIFGSGSTAKLQLNNFDAAVTSLVSSNANAIVENGSGTAATRTLTVSNGADNTFAGILRNGSTGLLALAKSGGGTLTLSNASNTFTGGITIYNGILEGTQTGTLGTGTITLADGTLKAAGTFTNAIASWANLSNNSAYTTSYLNNTIDTSAGSATFSGVLSGSGALNKTGANILTLSHGTNTYTGTLTSTAGTVSFASLNSAASLVMAGGDFTSTAATTVAAIAVNSPGTLTTTASNLTANSLTGSGTLNARTTGFGNGLKLAGSSNSGFSGSINVGIATGFYATLHLAHEDLLGTNADALSFNTAGGSGLLYDNGSPLSIANHRINLTGGNTLFLLGQNASGDMSITGGITGAGSVGIRSQTTKAIIIGGTNNDYTGDTRIFTDNAANSTLRLGGDNALPSGTGKGNLNLHASGTGTATFDMGGYDQTVNGLTSTGASSTKIIDIVSAGGSSTLTVGAGNATGSTFAGVIKNTTGTVSLEKIGTGTQTLTGNNTYSGTTTVTGGSLQVGSSGAGNTGAGAVTVRTGGTILGTGVIQGTSFTAQSGSTIHAGDGTTHSNFGTLNFTPVSGSGNFDFQSGSSVILGINPGGAGDLLSFDGLSAGTLNFNGNLSVTATGYTPTSVDVFNLIDWMNITTTTFASSYSAGSYGGYLLGNGDDNLGFDLPDISGSGYGWDISQLTTNGTISTVLLIPEPSRALLLLIGLVGLVTRRRRKQSLQSHRRDRLWRMELDTCTSQA
jgi:fibronectin-binding autotransporter adhesin